VNRVHHRFCASPRWRVTVEDKLLPWGLDGVDLGENMLEIGPGLGATTHVLAQIPGSLTALELDEGLCTRLRAQFTSSVEIVQGDATAMPFADGTFSGAACFTMLHHVPSAELQDRVFAEALRVLRPGAAFIGTDSLGGSLFFRYLHIGDICTTIDPVGLADRLAAAGFVDAFVETGGRSFRFRARKPG
jgi:ubiquinone/menaquinone biosynthesis C-methylase UbiE